MTEEARFNIFLFGSIICVVNLFFQLMIYAMYPAPEMVKWIMLTIVATAFDVTMAISSYNKLKGNQ